MQQLCWHREVTLVEAMIQARCLAQFGMACGTVDLVDAGV